MKWIEGKLKIEVNRDKSGTGPSQDTQLLGFRIHREGEVSIAPSALKRMKEKVRQIWERRAHRTEDELKTCWRRYIEGWWNYLGYANRQAEVQRLGGWIRRLLSCCLYHRQSLKVFCDGSLAISRIVRPCQIILEGGTTWYGQGARIAALR